MADHSEQMRAGRTDAHFMTRMVSLQKGDLIFLLVSQLNRVVLGDEYYPRERLCPF